MITERSLHHSNSTVGPRHEPYGRDEYMVSINGTDIALIVCALEGVWVEIDGRAVTETASHFSDEVQREATIEYWERLVGFKFYNWDRYFYRIHPPSDCDYDRFIYGEA